MENFPSPKFQFRGTERERGRETDEYVDAEGLAVTVTFERENERVDECRVRGRTRRSIEENDYSVYTFPPLSNGYLQ